MTIFRDAFAGPTGIGYLEAAANDVTQVDPAFSQDFMTVLFQHGIDVSQVDPATYDQLLLQAWRDPYLQDEFSSGVVTSMTAGISRQLFGTSATSPSTDKALLSAGLSLLAQQGIPLTPAQQQAAGLSSVTGAVSGQQRTPYLFDPQYFGIPGGYNYGQPVPTEINGMPGYASGIHEGQDYELPLNTPIYAPVAGTVHIISGATGYGNEAILTLANGWSIRLGHLNSFGVVDGQVVNPGDFLATSGSSGTSTGPHLLVEWRDPNGQAHDPNQLLAPIFAGETLGQTAARISDPTAAGTGLSYDAHLDAQYPGITSIWSKYFGTRPTPEQVAQVLRAAGPSGDAKAMEDFIRALPSHIAGMTAGQYYDLRGAADAASQKIVGHDSTDAIVKELFDQNMLTDQSIANWYNFHGITGNAAAGTTQVGPLGAAAYTAAYAANQGTMSGIYNESGFDPRVAIAQYGRSQPLPGEAKGIEPGQNPSEGPTATDQSQTADILSIPLTPPPPQDRPGHGDRWLMDQ